MNATGRLYVLDTNVLIHDPSALFRFQEHDVYLPMIVLEELDAAKKGISEVARAARQVSRFLDELIGDADRGAIEIGLALPAPVNNHPAAVAPAGHLYLQSDSLAADLPAPLPGKTPDNSILSTTIALSQRLPDKAVSLVSKDINLRIKARLLGLSAEDYYSDKVLDDVNLLYTGMIEAGEQLWSSGRDVECWQEGERTLYRLLGACESLRFPNQCVRQSGAQPFEGLLREVGDEAVVLERARDYRSAKNAVWGITARNTEQNFALNLLMDPEVDFVTMTGTAGTGKTLLALAAGLAQTLDGQRYREIVMTRVTVPVGEDIGFLPGTEEEKMTPWMGALLDNLEVLTESDVGGEWGRAATAELLQKRIKIRSLNFMRGRTFLNRYVIIDEAQNLTPKQMKTLITRAGPGTKLVCLGNIAQIDTPYLSETTSGLTYVVDRLKAWQHSGHIILRRGERSRLADIASEWL